MASSGSKNIAVTGWNDLIFEWSCPSSSQSTETNTSTVKWTLKLVSTSSGRIGSTATKNWSVTVNGQNYSGTNTVGIAANSSKILASGSTAIKHNSDGTKTFSYSFSQEFGITFSGEWIGTISGSGTGTLNTIATGGTSPDEDEPQYPVIPFRVDSISGQPSDNGTSFTVNFTNTIGGLKDSLQVCIAKTDGTTIVVPYKEIDKTSTSYTFYIADIKDMMAAAMPDALNQSFRVYFKLVEGSNNEYYYIQFRYSIYRDFTANHMAYDTNSATVALTNDNTTFIPGYSKVRLGMNVNKLYSDTELVSHYIEYNGSKRITDTVDTIVTDINQSSIAYYAKSKRGTLHQSWITNRKIFNGYYKPTIVIIPNHPGLNEPINITVKGIGFNGKFGDAGVNNPFTIQTRYKVNGGAYTEWKTENTYLSWNDGDYDCDISGIATATYRDTYTIQARIIDGLETVEAEPRDVIGAAVFDWGRDDFSFNVPINFPAGASYGIKALDNSGEQRWVLQTSNDNNNTVLGWGNYDLAKGDTNIYGNGMLLAANNNITLEAGNRIFLAAPESYVLAATPVFLLNDTDNDIVYDLMKLCRAIENSYLFEATATPGANYNSCSGDVRLCGNSLRVYFYGNRKTAPTTGDIANEEVMTLQFNHGGKIKNLYASGFTNATVGGVTTFSCSGEKVSDTVMKIKITLAATTTTGTAYDGFFWVPCVLNINNF